MHARTRTSCAIIPMQMGLHLPKGKTLAPFSAHGLSSLSWRNFHTWLCRWCPESRAGSSRGNRNRGRPSPGAGPWTPLSRSSLWTARSLTCQKALFFPVSRLCGEGRCIHNSQTLWWGEILCTNNALSPFKVYPHVGREPHCVSNVSWEHPEHS